MLTHSNRTKPVQYLTQNREIKCRDCRKQWKVVKSSPKFTQDFQQKVEYDREHNM